jgi:N-methylhydantoinase A
VHTLNSEGIPQERIRIEYAADIRYVGQFNEVEVSVDFEDKLEGKHLNDMAQEFHRQHDRLYGYALPSADLELINVRTVAYGVTKKPAFAKASRADSMAEAALRGHRDAFFGETFITVPVYDGLQMKYGHRVEGPCIVEQPTTTIVVPERYDLGCDEYENYVMYRRDLLSEEHAKRFVGA